MLSLAIDNYLAIRRAVGFELKVQEGLLRNFARYSAERSQTHVCRQAAIDWAAQAPSPYQRENRLAIVRLFARHARAEDPRHDLIPRQVFARQRRRPFPYLFSAGELRQLLGATACLRPRGSLRPHTYYTLFGLLAVTGLRISEAIRLRLDDVTADGLIVRMSKFRKSRLVPLHSNTICALECKGTSSERADWCPYIPVPFVPWNTTLSSVVPSSATMTMSLSQPLAGHSVMPRSMELSAFCSGPLSWSGTLTYPSRGYTICVTALPCGR